VVLPVALVPLHTCVPGRARIRIGGLQGSPELARRLWTGLSANPGVSWVRASDLTGNVTIEFDGAFGLRAIYALICAVLRGDAGHAHTGAHHWHASPTLDVVQKLSAHPSFGLTDAVAKAYLQKHGRNIVKAAPSRSTLSIFAGQFASLPVAVLAGAALMSLGTGVIFDAVAIAIVLAINGFIGLLTESHAEATLRSLKGPGPTHARVIRNCVVQRLPASEVVPGDIMVLRRGTLVAADARVLTEQNLSVTEAMLTGESLPVVKAADALPAVDAPLADRCNMVYRGTVVTSGSGTAVVVATGAQTEAGRVHRLVEASEPPQTPTYQQLTRLGARLAWLTGAASLLLFAVGRLRGFGVLHMLRSAVSLAVASVPEGLPMVATTTHAIGVNALRGKDVFVRRLDAIETLASVNVVCFDKTGTLTENKMSVAEISSGDRSQLTANEQVCGVIEKPLRTLLETACLCSEVEVTSRDGTRHLEGSSTEVALVTCAERNGVDLEVMRGAKPPLSLQQRTETHRFMVTMHADDGQVLIAMKGNPSEILARCQYEATVADSCKPLTSERRDVIETKNEAMASKGLRVLGFSNAYASASDTLAIADSNMIWLGAAGLHDPVRPSVHGLMHRLHRAGVRTVMLTGDQRQTAQAVAREIGLAEGKSLQVLEESDVEQLSRSALQQRARGAHVFARVTPGQKLKIVRALQDAGAVIAMVGDGINDSPALRAAHVGVAMGMNGDAAAREVADLFLHTEDLGRLAHAVEQGRTTHANIRKSLRFILSTNTSEVLLMLAAAVLGLGEGLTPTQLLWINIITDVLPGIGLAVEEVDPRALETGPPSPDLPILGEGEVGVLLAEGAILASGALLAGGYGAYRFGANSHHMRSMTFFSLVAAQLQHAIACRTPGENPFQRKDLKANPTLTMILTASFALQAAAYFIPSLRRALGLAPIGISGGIVTALSSVLPSLIMLGRTRKEPAATLPQLDEVRLELRERR
jgi:P-type Ca2+ transporter type 2C